MPISLWLKILWIKLVSGNVYEKKRNFKAELRKMLEKKLGRTGCVDYVLFRAVATYNPMCKLERQL